MVNNVCVYSMGVNLLTVLIKPRLIFYADVTPLKINRWKRKCIIQRWDSFSLSSVGSTFTLTSHFLLELTVQNTCASFLKLWHCILPQSGFRCSLWVWH